MAERLVVEVARGELRIGDIQRRIASGGQPGEEGAERGGFAGAHVPGEHGEPPFPCRVVQPRPGLLHGRGGQQPLGGKPRVKGVRVR